MSIHLVLLDVKPKVRAKIVRIFNMPLVFEYTRLLTTYKKIKMQPSPNGKSNNEPDAILTF